MTALDRTDLEMVVMLAEDPRATIVSMADALGLSRNTVQLRMTKIERSGIFASHERSVAPGVLGFPQQAFLRIAVRQNELSRIIGELAHIPEVIQAHRVSGAVDLLVGLACRDARHLFDTDAKILAIDGVERTETSLVMEEVIPFRVSGLLRIARREA